jgi:hypothetical protein
MGLGARSYKWVPSDAQQSIRPWKAGMRRHEGGLGRPSFFVRCHYFSNSHDMKSFYGSNLVVC